MKSYVELIFDLKKGLITVEEFIAELDSMNTVFVRTQTQLAIDSPKTAGLRIKPQEALEIFGIKVLIYVLLEDSKVILCHQDEPHDTFKRRREFLKVTRSEVAEKTGLEQSEIERAETRYTKNSIHNLIKIANALGLDPRFISIKRGDEKRGYLY